MKKVTLGKFQQLEQINKKDISEIDKVLFSICVIYDMTEYELNNEDPGKVLRLMSEVERIFSVDYTERKIRSIGKYIINYDISKMTFGQYVELAFFLNDPLQNAHYILASASNFWLRKHVTKNHRKRAEYFLKQPAGQTIPAFKMIVEAFAEFNKEYKKLFENDGSGEGTADVEFNKRYGWIYSATQVAEYERVTLDEVFAFPVRRALNALVYLKAKVKYEADQLRKTNKTIA